MDPSNLQMAQYRDAQWYVLATDTTGGRRTVKHEFVNSDLQIIQDFGLTPRSFRLDGVIAPRRSNTGQIIQTYEQVRDNLLFALEKGGTGILIHPFYGRMENIVALTWSLNERISDLGSATISIDFAISNTDGIPQATGNVISSVNSANNEVVSTVSTSTASIWEVLTSAIGNFADAVEKITDFIDKVRSVTDSFAPSAGSIDVFSSDLNSAATNANSLASDSTSLADQIASLFSSMDGLYESSEDALSVFMDLFDFGDDDTEILLTTFSRINKQNNRDALNNAVQSLALSYSYLNASQVEYDTVDEIEETASLLETQYKKLAANASLDPDVFDSLSELRSVTQEFFDAELLTARRVITVNTEPISIRGLAFQYYGSSELGDEIGELNEFLSGARVQGDVKILTQ